MPSHACTGFKSPTNTYSEFASGCFRARCSTDAPPPSLCSNVENESRLILRWFDNQLSHADAKNNDRREGSKDGLRCTATPPVLCPHWEHWELMEDACHGEASFLSPFHFSRPLSICTSLQWKYCLSLSCNMSMTFSTCSGFLSSSLNTKNPVLI